MRVTVLPVGTSQAQLKTAVPGSVIFLYNDALNGGKTPAGMEHNCPCGCGEISYCGLSPALNTDAATWTFNGDVANPTLTPSLQVRFPCKWHGYLTNGEWIKI